MARCGAERPRKSKFWGGESMRSKLTGTILTLLMAVCLVVSICAGCGGAPTQISAPPAVTASPTAIPSPAPSDNSEALSDEEYGRREEEAEKEAAKNLWITVQDITENGVLMDSIETDDGARSDTHLYDDIIRVVIERIPLGGYGMDEAAARTAELERIAQSDIDAQEAGEELLLSYPAYRLAYEKNGNRCMDLYVQTDLCHFRIHTEFPIDIPGMDAGEEDGYIEQTIVRWFYNADIIG